jgi:hypothetical protein
LEYETPGAGDRVFYTREGDRATVVIHRLGRRAQRALDETASAVGELVVYAVIACVIAVWFSPLWLAVLVPGVAVVLAGVYGLAWLWHARLDRPIVIELTPTELVFSNLDTQPRARRFSRGAVYAIRYVGHAKSIFVYRRGEELYGFGVGPEGAEAERIAAFLRETAGLGEGG